MKQLEISFGTGHGGRRVGAGRPMNKSSESHAHKAREKFTSKQPLHITVKLVNGLSTLRSKIIFKLLKNDLNENFFGTGMHGPHIT